MGGKALLVVNAFNAIRGTRKKSANQAARMAAYVGGELSLIAEVESAVSSGSPDQRVDTLRRVTDLFLGSADHYSEEHVGVFDDVISRLAERIEMKARAELANRLAPVKNAPTNVVRALARDQSLDVAGPVLSQSPRLTEDDLLQVARSHGQDRLLAISKRATLSEAVSDVLVERGDREVVRSVARNEGARFSSTGYGRLVEKSASDDDLAVTVGLRKDIPQEHFHELVSKASEAVFKKLAAANPAAVGDVKRVLSELTGANIAAEPKVEHDYTQAKAAFERVLRSGEAMDPALNRFAGAGKFEETVVALAVQCRLPIPAVERIMIDKRSDSDLILILAKAAGASWPTAKHILLLRRGKLGLSALDVDSAQRNYEKLQPSTAQRVVRFYQVRHAAGDKSH